MLGLMLARMGIDVIVLEKHTDFLRDFRSDDISPGTIEILGQLGLAEEFLSLNPKLIKTIKAHTPGGPMILADLERVRTSFPTTPGRLLAGTTRRLRARRRHRPLARQRPPPPGNAGSNTFTDHKEVPAAASRRVPARFRRKILIRVDGAGASHDLIGHMLSLSCPRKTVLFTCGWMITAADEDAIRQVPAAAWNLASTNHPLNAKGGTARRSRNRCVPWHPRGRRATSPAR